MDGSRDSHAEGKLTDLAFADAPVGLALFDCQMNFIAASRRFLQQLGVNPDAPVVGRSYYEVFPEQPPEWRSLHLRALAGETLHADEDAFPRATGQTDWITWSLKPLRLTNGLVAGVILSYEQITRQVHYKAELAAAEARYRAVFNQASIGVAVVSLSGELLECNDRFNAIAGDDPGGLVKRELAGTPEPAENDDAAPPEAAVRHIARPDGSSAWVEITRSLIRGADCAPLYQLLLMQDVSARHAAETQRKLMTDELNHRVRNTLAVVQSMARESLAAGRPPENARERFESRLHALAAAHTILTRENWDVADLSEVLAVATGAKSDSRLLLEGPKTPVNSALTVTLSLALHELYTNAQKHGALSRPEGRVRLTWALADGRLAIRWKESGGPPVAPPAYRGFGARLLERALRAEPGGRVQTAYERDGLVCELSCDLQLPAEPLRI